MFTRFLRTPYLLRLAEEQRLVPPAVPVLEHAQGHGQLAAPGLVPVVGALGGGL
jgi:hypothetical protein